MGLLPDDVDFDSPWSDASDELQKVKQERDALQAELDTAKKAVIELGLQYAEKDQRIAQLEAELSTVKEGRKLYKEIADEAIAERDALKSEIDDNVREWRNNYYKARALQIETEKERDALQADIDMLLKQPQGQVAFNAGMERAAEIAETDTFAPPYGKRIADAIRAEIPEGNDE